MFGNGRGDPRGRPGLADAQGWRKANPYSGNPAYPICVCTRPNRIWPRLNFVAFLVPTLLAVILFRRAVLGLRGKDKQRGNS
jgi:hypothetical protein